MSVPLTAEDLWPIVSKMPPPQQVRLAKMALRDAITPMVEKPMSVREDAQRLPDDLGESEDDELSWEGYGWGSFDTPH